MSKIPGDDAPASNSFGPARTPKKKRRSNFTSFEEFVDEQDPLNEAGRGHAWITKYVHGIEHPTFPHEQDTAAQDPENHQKSREEEEAQSDPPEDTISHYEEAPILSPSPPVQPTAVLDKAVRHPKPQHESQEEEGLLPSWSEDTSLHEEKAPVLDRKGYRELKLPMSDGAGEQVAHRGCPRTSNRTDVQLSRTTWAIQNSNIRRTLTPSLCSPKIQMTPEPSQITRTERSLVGLGM